MSRIRQNLKIYLTVFFLGSTAFFLRWLPSFWAYFKRGEKVFLGINILPNLADVWAYWADILVGKKGSFLLINQFGNGSVAKFFIKPFYVFLGHWARIFNLRVELVYFLAAYFSALALTVSLFYFSSLFFESLRWRYFTVGLTLLSGPLALALPVEAIPFHSLAEPHFSLVQAGLVLIFYLFLTHDLVKSAGQRKKRLVFLFSIGIMLSLIHVFINWLVVGILFSWLIISTGLKQKRLSVSPILYLIVSSLPMSFYSLWLLKDHLFFKIFIEQNILPSAGPSLTLAQLGVFLFLIPFSFKLFKTERKAVFLLVWLTIQLLATYFPVPWQRRLIEGWWLSVSFLASLGIFYLFKTGRFKKKAFVSFLVLIIFTLAFSNQLSFLIMEVYYSILAGSNVYVSQAEVEAWNFFLPRCDFSEVVFTSLPRGSYLPAKTGCRSWIGHPVQTPDFGQKRIELKKIISGEMSPKDLARFLEEREISYVLLSCREAQGVKPQEVDNLGLAFENEEFVVYERN